MGVTDTNWHGPGHLFCAGCASEMTALGWAAWAGMAMARGDRQDAERCQSNAVALYGQQMMSIGDINVRYRGPGTRPTARSVGLLLKMLETTHEALVECERVEAERAAANAPAPVPPTPGAAGQER